MTHPERAIEAGARVLCSEMIDNWSHGKKYWRSVMQSVITALAAEGLVVVPKDPTEAMLKAGHAGEYNRPVGRYANIYRAMLAAAQEQNDPLPPAQEG